MAARFSVVLTPRFIRDLQRLPTDIQEKITESLRTLEDDAFGPPPRIKKLKGKGIGQWRLEVWPYRIRYDVIDREVVLYRVRHRKDIYRD